MSTEQTLIDYFLHNRTQQSWVLDRESNKQVVSIAASGFGLSAWAIAANKGIISKKTALEWINQSVNSTIKANMGNQGFYYHFININGKPIYTEEVSLLDTVLYLYCLKDSARRLHDDNLNKLFNQLVNNIDVNILLDKDNLFFHGFYWRDGKIELIPYKYNDCSEGILVYKFFDKQFKPRVMRYDLPLFCYYYPLAFYKDKEMINILGKAIEYQENNSRGMFGFTTTDLPDGGYGMRFNVVSPLSIYSCRQFSPSKCDRLLTKLKTSPTVSAITIDGKWKSKDKIGIDYGAALLLTQGY